MRGSTWTHRSQRRQLDSTRQIQRAITIPRRLRYSTAWATRILTTTYYRKLGPNDWETYLYVDGVQVDGPDSLQFSTSGALITPAGPGTITTPSFTPSGGGAAMPLTLDYSNTSQFGSPFAVHSLNQDGFTAGRLIGIDIDDQGVIFTRFTNGQSRIEGQLALANFPNPQGLQPLGDTAWAETFSSGDVTVGAPGASNLGLVQSGALEESNVDLAEQLVKMIVAQRNFQANAEVISTTDAQSIINPWSHGDHRVWTNHWLSTQNDCRA